MANISKELNQIKNAIYGKEVRGSIHDGIDKVNKESEGSRVIANNTDSRQTAIEQQFDDLQQNYTEGTPSTAEVVAARTNTETNENYETIGRRMDNEFKKVTTQLAQTAKMTYVNEELGKKATKTELAQGLSPKADQAFVDAQFASIVSGAPKGTFANLQALKDAYPNGTEGIFLVLADGHWYYWNETEKDWLDGGVYQALPWGNFMTEQDEEWVI